MLGRLQIWISIGFNLNALINLIMYTYYLRYLFIGALVCLNYQFVLAQNNSETFVSTHPDKTAYASIKGLLDTALSHNDFMQQAFITSRLEIFFLRKV